MKNNVVINGINSNWNADVARAKLAHLLKTSESNVEKIVKSGGYTVKKGVSPEIAKKYQIAIEASGGICSIVEQAAEINQLNNIAIPVANIHQEALEITTKDTSNAVDKNELKSNSEELLKSTIDLSSTQQKPVDVNQELPTVLCSSCGKRIPSLDGKCIACGTSSSGEQSRIIKIIPLWKMMIATKGKAAGIAVLGFIPLAVIGGIIMLLNGINDGNNRNAFMGLLCVTFFGLCFIIFIPQGKYKPGKSLAGYRSKTILIEQSIKYGYWIIGILVAGFVFIDPASMVRSIGLGISGFVAMYYTKKTIKLHGDVDFVVNEYLAKALGIDIRENVLVSYQDFESENLKKGNNVFAVSATKFVYATFDGERWNKLSRNLDQITHIGVTADPEQNYFVKLIFIDSNEVMLKIGLFDKATSNPTMVIGRLLEAIDESLLSKGPLRQTIQRRRVIVSSDATVNNINTNVKPILQDSKTRSIDLAPTILEGIKSASEISGRRIEL